MYNWVRKVSRSLCTFNTKRLCTSNIKDVLKDRIQYTRTRCLTFMNSSKAVQLYFQRYRKPFSNYINIEIIK